MYSSSKLKLFWLHVALIQLVISCHFKSLNFIDRAQTFLKALDVASDGGKTPSSL